MHSRVRYVQTGGVAGLRFVAEIDTASGDAIGAIDSVDLEHLIEAALKEHASRAMSARLAKRTTASPPAKAASRTGPTAGAALPSMAQMPDALHYDVVVTRGATSTRMTADEHGLDGALGALIAAVKPHAKPTR